MKPQIEQAAHDFSQDLNKIDSLSQLEKTRIKYLGRKRGIILKLFAKLSSLKIQEKRLFGPQLRSLRSEIEKKIIAKKKSLESPQREEWFDISAPAKEIPFGHLNPLTLVLNEVKDIFHHLGFTFVDGPEVESDIYNFQKLLLPINHPSRDTQQTYYLDQEILLRTHTSPMQIRYMEKNQPPLRMISPGRVYRRDQIDATHLPQFMHFEGLLVDQTTNLGELIGTLRYLTKQFFGKESVIRVYGHNFPYTEPSIEIEMYHQKLKKWVEIGGAGMVHPDVLRNVNINPNVYQGFAFGMGLERFAMLKYGIEDIRLFYSGDLRFLEQF